MESIFILVEETHINTNKYIIFTELNYNKLYSEWEMNRLIGTKNATIQLISFMEKIKTELWFERGEGLSQRILADQSVPGRTQS